MGAKPKLAMYWAAACGGCEIALVNIHETLLEVDAHFDFMFCPCLLDTKKAEVEALPDGDIAVTLFNGAIRTNENEEMAKLLRKKSKVLVSFGSCSSEGCIPGLGNLSATSDLIRTVYEDKGTTVHPQEHLPVPEGTLHLPVLNETIRPLSDYVEVDYSLPGCPPEAPMIREVVKLLISGTPLPPRGSVLGAGRSSVCDQCAKKKSDKKISGLRRTYEFIPDPTQCLLEQGLLCMGIATRDGCGALCPAVNMPCIGCYGPPEGVLDQGAKMIGALGSMWDIDTLVEAGEAKMPALMAERVKQIPDPAGTFYKFSLPGSLYKGVRK
jgi:F420-non-reducing hydrogenase small subunit